MIDAEPLRGYAGRTAIALGAVLLLGIAFGAFLDGRFVWDDVPLVRDNPALYRLDGAAEIVTRDLWGQATGEATQLYHPLPMLSLWAQGVVHGKSLVGFRLGNLLLHALVALCLAGVLRRLRTPAPVAALSALVFLVHPLVTEPVMWLTGRHDLLGTLFTLCAMRAWPAPAAARAVAAKVLVSTLCCAAAFLSKEPYVVAPLLVASVALFDHLARDRDARARSGPAALLWPAVTALGPCAVFALRHALGISAGAAQLGASPIDHLTNLVAIDAHYAALVLRFGEGATFALLRPPTAIDVALFGALVVLSLVAVLRGARDASVPWLRVCVALAIFWLSLLPHLVSVPTIGFYGNRYGYLALAGAAVALASGVEHVLGVIAAATPAMRRACAGLAAIGLLLAALATGAHAATWRTPETFYTAAIDADPDNGIAWYHLGHAVQVERGCERALPLFVKAWKLRPTYPRASHNVAGCLIQLGRAAEALAPARAALALAPAAAGRHYNLAVALAATGAVEEAKRHLRRALELDAGHVGASHVLAQLSAGAAAAPPAGSE